MADKSAAAIRSIAGQNTFISRNIHDMAYDAARDEIYAMQTAVFAIMVFKGDANGDVPPIRKIMGPHTQLNTVPEAIGRLALDPVNHEIYVPMGTKVAVYPQTGDGDIPPLRVLEGPATGLGASAVSIDPVHNLMMISGRVPGWGRRVNVSDLVIDGGSKFRKALDGGSIGRIAIFDRSASGNTKPLRVIQGSKTLLSTPQTVMSNYPPRGWIFGAVEGSDEYGETAEASEMSFVGVWHINDNGDVAPHWTIGGPHGIIRQARGVTLDPKHKTVIVSDKHLNGVLSFEFPELF